MSSDDEIPDLFPAGPAPAPKRDARPSAAPTRRDSLIPTAPSRPSAPPHRPSAPPHRPSVPVRVTSRPPPPLPDSERPSRPLPGPSSGLELDVAEESLHDERKQTAVFGTSDELEFDPMSGPQALGWEVADSPRAQPSAPLVSTLDLEFPLPSSAPSGMERAIESPRERRVESVVPTLEVRASSPPPAAKPRVEVLAKPVKTHSSVPPPSAGWGSFPAMGNEVELGGGFDDLEFGGAEAAQLNVALPRAEHTDDVPWPIARTPVGDELAVSRQEIEEYSGFGPKPKSIFQTPLYTLRVLSVRKDLREKHAALEQRLLEVEDLRDETLATLGETKRAELQSKERFSLLYSGIDRHDEMIVHKRRVLESADVEGAEALRNVQAHIDTEVLARTEKEKARDEKRAIFSESEISHRRNQAALKRVEIEWRNLKERVARAGGEVVPAEFVEKLEQLEEQRHEAEKTLVHSQEQLKRAKAFLEEAENDVRLAVAAVQRFEGQKEGLLLTYEGDIADYSRALDEAMDQRRRDLAQAGRAIIELRGEVPVDAEVRRALLEADAAVHEAARQELIAKLAILSMDHASYRTGRTIWGFLALAVVAILIALAY